MKPCVYILASRRNGTLYVGATSDVRARLEQHRSGAIGGFTAKYGVTRLVYVEFHDRLEDARTRERRMKKWRRAWKIELIERSNPDWRDIAGDLPD